MTILWRRRRFTIITQTRDSCALACRPAERRTRGTRMTLVVHAVRIAFGAYYLLAGAAWFIPAVALQGADSRWFLEALVASGLFSFMKLFQVRSAFASPRIDSFRPRY